MICIATQRLSRRFGSVQAVNNLDLAVPQASLYILLGLNGAGKTTTMRLLVGLIAADDGDIRVLGLRIPSDRRIILRQIGTFLERPSLYPHLTGEENLRVTALLGDARTADVATVIAKLGLSPFARRLVRSYSSGMRQRLALALALLRRPRLLILDEPTRGLDPAGASDIRELLRSLVVQNGTTILMSTHHPNDIEASADNIGILHRGALLYQGSVSSLRATHTSSIRLCVSDSHKAAACLGDHGWKVKIHPDGLTVHGCRLGPQEVSAVNTLLVTAGLDVYHLSIQSASLETIFLSMIA